MTKKSQANKISLKTIHEANKLTPYARVKEALSWRERGLNESQIEELYVSLYEWVQKPTSLSITAFCKMWGMTTVTFYKYVKKSPELAYVHELTKEIIGCRREKLAMFKEHECNEKTIHRTLHMYHPDWKEAYNAEIALKKELSKDEVNKKPTNITVVMEDFGSKHSDKDKA